MHAITYGGVDISDSLLCDYNIHSPVIVFMGDRFGQYCLSADDSRHKGCMFQISVVIATAMSKPPAVKVAGDAGDDCKINLFRRNTRTGFFGFADTIAS